MLDPDDGQWLTYREAGLILGISPEATRSLARRKGWARQTPNEIGGVARVLLPTGADRRSRPGETDGVTGVARRATVERPTVVSVDGAPGDRAGVLAVEIAIVALREQLAAAGAWRRPCLAGSIARLRGRDRTRRVSPAASVQQLAGDVFGGDFGPVIAEIREAETHVPPPPRPAEALSPSTTHTP